MTEGKKATRRSSVRTAQHSRRRATAKEKHIAWNERMRYRIRSPDPTDRELDVIKVSTDFCQRTSSQGISQVFNAPGGSKKLFWTILTLGTLAILTGHLYYVISQFLMFETTTEVTVVPAKLLEFPAVTVCNHNAVRMLPYQPPEYATPTNESHDFVEKFDELPDIIGQDDSSLGHQKEDLIVQATFDNHRVDINEEFTMTMNARYGNCYTFNMNATRSTRRAMPGYGLELLLNIEHYAYNSDEMYKPVDWVGAIVQIHRSNVEPTPQDGGIPVAPNTLNRMALAKTQLLRKGGLYGDCLNTDDEHPSTYYTGEYTREHCENTCLQKKVIEKCCCYLKVVKYDLSNFTEPWFQDEDDQIGNWTMCARDDIVACIDDDACWKTVWERYDSGRLSCSHCRDACRETLYHTTVASVPWPSKNSQYQIREDLEKNARLGKMLMAYGISLPFEVYLPEKRLKENFLKVQIYYSSLTTTYITELPAIGHFEFVSELGGTFGLWIGWTVLTVFEFVEFLVDLVVLRLTRSKRHNGSSS